MGISRRLLGRFDDSYYDDCPLNFDDARDAGHCKNRLKDRYSSDSPEFDRDWDPFEEDTDSVVWRIVDHHPTRREINSR